MSKQPGRRGPENPDICIGMGAVAARFGRSRDWLYRNLNKLILEDGFPRPVTTIGRERLWDPSSVDAWFKRFSPARQQSSEGEGADGEAANDVRGRLAMVYGGGAA